jgi:hypothetical protein
MPEVKYAALSIVINNHFGGLAHYARLFWN